MSSMFLLNSLMVGGSVKKTARIANALHGREHELHIGYLSPPDSLKGDFAAALPLKFFDRGGKFEFRIANELRRYILAHGITNLFCINLYPSLYGMLGGKGLQGLHIYVCINITDFQTRKEHLQMWLYRPLLRMATGIVFGCRRQQVSWTDRYGLPQEKSTVIYNGVDGDFFSPEALADAPPDLRKKFGFSSRDLVIINVAEFRPEKAQNDLLRACAGLRRKGYPVRLVLVGDGPTKRNTEWLVSELGLEEVVHFRGRLSDVRTDLAAADVFALPSTAVETFSNAALEAMAMGKPAVLSDIGGASEMVLDGVNGYLFPPGNVAQLAGKLEILAKDDALRRQMGANAAALVRERFGFNAMLEQYENLMAPGGLPAVLASARGGDWP